MNTRFWRLTDGIILVSFHGGLGIGGAMTTVSRCLDALVLAVVLMIAAGSVDAAFAQACAVGCSPAPGPVAGVGLPALAIGYGAYWLVKRFRKSDQ